MDQAGEGPDRQEQEARDDVELEGDRHVDHELGARLEDQHRAQPGADRLAVVVAVGVGELVEDRGGRAQQNRDDEEAVHDQVVAGGGQAHALDDDASVDEPGQAHDRQDGREGSHVGGAQVVHVLGDAQHLGDVLGYQEPDDVTAHHHEEAQVEQGGGQAQDAGLVPLRGAGGPAELVGAPPPDHACHQQHQAGVGQGHPHEVLLNRAHVMLSWLLVRGKGRRPVRDPAEWANRTGSGCARERWGRAGCR